MSQNGGSNTSGHSCTGDGVWHKRVCGARYGRLKLAGLCQRGSAVVSGSDQGGCGHSLGPGVPSTFYLDLQTPVTASL